MSHLLSRRSDPTPFRKLLDDAVRQTRKTARPLYLWLLLPALGFQVPMALLQGFQFKMAGATEPSAAALGGVLAGCGLLVISLPIYWFCSVAVALAAADGVAGRPVSPGQRMRTALHPRIWLTLILVLILVFAPPVLAMTVGMAFTAILGGSSPAVAAVGMLASLALSLLAFVFVATRLAIILPVMAEEGTAGFTAIGRTYRLISSNPVRRFMDNTVTKVFVVGLVFYALNYALTLPLQAPFTAGFLFSVIRSALEGGAPDQILAQGSAPWMMALATLMGAFGQSAALLYFFNALALLYFDVRRRREAPDLLAAVAELEQRQNLLEPPLPPASVAPPAGWGANPA